MPALFALSPTTARVAGVLTGLVLFSALVQEVRMPPGPQVLGTDVTIAIAPTGEIGVQPAGPVFVEAGLRPGRPVREHDAEVVNRTGKRMVVTVRSRPSGDDLDGELALALSRDDRALWHGRERDLRVTGTQVTLEPGEHFALGVSASVPADVQRWSGRLVNVDLLITSAVAA
jgi:hypothetical protein